MTTTTSVAIHAGATTEDAGHGEPALLCIPGWCGGRDVFDGLVPRLARHRRVMATDLPGHAGTPDSRGDFTAADVTDDLVARVDTSGADRVVPVALSHAGWFALELRRRLGPERVPGVVLLDWMVLGTPPGFADALAGLQSADSWEAVRAGLFGMWTADLDVPALHTYVDAMGRHGEDMWRRAGREIAAGFAAAPVPLAAFAALETPCPTLHLYAQPADEGHLAAQQAFAADHPWFEVRRLDAASHFPMFEVPDTMAASIEEFACTLT